MLCKDSLFLPVESEVSLHLTRSKSQSETIVGDSQEAGSRRLENQEVFPDTNIPGGF